MKKLLAVMLAVFLLAAIAPAAFADDTVYTEGTLHYTISNDSVTIVDCFGKDAEVTVPAMIAGYPVNTIASGAFAENEYVQTLYLPDTITTIEPGAIGGWIHVVYNANTDHPQDTPSDLILGLLEPAPPVTEEETVVPEPVAQDGTETQTGSGSEDLDDSSQTGGQTQTGTQISEQEVGLEELEETTGESVPASPAPEAAESPAPAEEQPDPGQDGENAPETATEQNESGDSIGAGAAVAVGALAVLGAGLALVSKRKAKTRDQA